MSISLNHISPFQTPSQEGDLLISKTKKTLPNITNDDILKYSWLKEALEQIDSISQESIDLFPLESADGILPGISLPNQSYSKSIPHFLKNIRKSLQFMQSCGYCVPDIDFAPYEKCLEIYKKMLTTDSEAYAEELVTTMRNLRKNETILIPGGYKDDELSCMLYKFEKQKNGKFTFTIINTEATDYHDSIVTSEKHKYKSHVSFKDIKADKIYTKEFFKQIIDLQAPKKAGSIYSSSDIYIGFVNYLQGKQIVNKLRTFFQYKTPQRSASSSIKSLFAELFHQLNEKGELENHKGQHYKLLKFFYKRESILTAFKSYLESKKYEKTVHRLLSKAVNQWVDNARKLLSHGNFLNEELLKKVECTAIHMKESLEQHRIQHQVIEKTPLQDYSMQEINQVVCNPVTITKTNIDDSFTKKTENKALDFSSTLFPIDVARLTADTIVEYLKELSKVTFKTLNQALHYPIQIVRALPIPTCGNDVWSELPQEKIADVLIILFLFAVNCEYSAEGFEHIKDQQFIAKNVLLAITDKLVRRLPECKLTKNDKVSHYELLVFFFFGVKSVFNHPEDHQRMVDLLKYFDPEIDLSKAPITEPYKKHLPFKEETVLRASTIFNTENYYVAFDKSELYKQNPTVIFLERFLQSDQTKKALAEESLSSSPHYLQMAHLYGDNLIKRKFIPLGIHLLRQLALKVQYRTMIKEPSTFEFYVRKSDSSETHFAILMYKNSKHETMLADYKNLTAEKDSWLHSSEDLFKGLELPASVVSSVNENKIMSETLLEDTRESKIINVNPKDEVFRAFAYFMNGSLEKLEERRFQQALYIHLFKPGRLLFQVSNEPASILKVYDSIQYFFNKFLIQQKFQAAAFFAALAARCSKHIEHYKQLGNCQLSLEHIDIIKNRTNVFKIAVLSAIEDMYLSPTEYADIYNEFAVMHEASTLTLCNNEKEFYEMAIDLISANFLEPIAFMQKPDSILERGYMIARKKNVSSLFLPEIISGFKKNPKLMNDALNGVIKSIYKGVSIPKCINHWIDLGDGLYESEDKKYSIDILKNVLTVDGKQIIGLPTEVITHKKFQKLFKEIKNVRAINQSQTLFEIEDAQGVSKLKLSSSSSTHMMLERRFNGDNESYRYVNIDSTFDDLMPKEIYDAIPVDIIDLDDQKTSVWFKHETDATKAYYLIESHVTNKKLYVILKNNNLGYTIDSISDTLENKRFLINPHITQDKFLHLNAFVPLNKIEFWAVHKNNKPQLSTIEIPHLSLCFRLQNIEGQDYAMCREVPGYFIAPSQDIDFVGKDGHCLVLMNHLGHKKVLVLRTKYESNSEGIHYFDPVIELTPLLKKDNGAFFVYDLENKNGKLRLKPSSVIDALQLVSLLFMKKRYRQVHYYLNYVHALYRYSKKETTIFMQLMTHSDMHPSANALKLKLFVMLKENELKYASKSSLATENGVELGKIYSDYLQNRGNLSVCELSIDEEKLLLQVLQKSDAMFFPILAQRMSLLLDPTSVDTKEGIKTSLKLPHATKLSSVGVEEFLALFHKFNPADKNSGQIDWEEFVGLQDQQFMETFATLYFYARHGNEAIRKRIKNMLELQEGSKALSSEKNIAYACLIKKMCSYKNNILFPTSLELYETKSFAYKGSFTVGSQKYEDDYKKKYKAWSNNRINFYNKIKRLGENSRSFGFIDALKEIKNDFKKSKFYNPIHAKKIYRSEPVLKSISNIEKPLNLDHSIIEKDKEWNHFFDNCLAPNSGFFKTTKNENWKPEKVEQSENLPEGKKKTILESIESFYRTIPESKEQYVFDLDKEESFLKELDKLLTAQIESVFPKNDKLYEELLSTLSFHADSIESKIELLISLRRIKIEFLASRLPENIDIKDRLARVSKKDKTLTIKDLIPLFEKGSKNAYLTSSKFSENQCLEIDKEIGMYAIETTRSLQLKQVLELLKELKLAKDPAEKEISHQRLGEQIKIKRSHLINGLTDRSRQYLRFEMQEKIILRDVQIKVLEALSSKELLQLLQVLKTGSGKTSVLMAAQQHFRRSKEPKLLLNVWPNQHYEENKKHIRNQVIEIYGQRTDSFDFNRQSDISPDSLFFIYTELLKAISEGRQLNTTPESLQNIELRFLEVLFDITVQGVSYPNETVPLFQKILKLMKSGEIHVDEGHKNLSSKREVNFTIGDPTRESETDVSLIADIYRFLVEDEEVRNLVKLQSNEQNYLSEESYQKIVAPKIADHFAVKWNISKEHYKEFLEYVTTKEKDVPECLKMHPQLQLIALLRGELVFVLKETLSKNTCVHYGRSKKDKNLTCEYAKPYDANDSCVETAEYDNTTETLNKTYQTYLYKRLSLAQQKKLLQFIKDSIESELKQKTSEKEISENETYKFFVTHFPKELAKKSIFSVTNKDIETHFETINASNEIQFYYVNKIVVPQIKKYRYILKSDAQNLRSMFKDVTALTATPGSVHSYGFSDHASMKDHTLNYGNDAEVLNMLNRKCSDNSKFQIVHSEVPVEILNNILDPMSEKDQGIRMLTDIGSLFKGISNLEIAKKILVKIPYIKGVVFYDDLNRLMILERDNNKIIPLKESLLIPQERFTYCDNKHMFGSDITQSPNAVGICTFGLHNDLDDILQGVGRLREFLKDQEARWVTTAATMNGIDPAYKDKASYFHVICDFAIENQEFMEKEKLFRSLKQQMRNEIRSFCMSKLINCDVKKSGDLFKKFKEILVHIVDSQPIIIYGRKQEVCSGVEALRNYKTKLLESLEKIKSGFTKKEYKAISDRLSLYEQKFVDFEKKNLIPKEVKEFNGQIGTESEIQCETETNIEVETLAESRDGLHYRLESKWPEKLDLYSNWIKPTSLRKVINKTRSRTLDIARVFKDKFFAPMKFTKKILNEIKKVSVNSPQNRKTKKRVACFFHIVVSTVNVVAFAIFGLPIFLALGIVTWGIDIFKWVFMRGKNVQEQIKVTKYGRNRARKACKTKVALYPLAEVINIHTEKEISQAKDFFKEENNNKILFTNNLLRKVPEKKDEISVKALGKEQKTIHEVLVVEEVIKGKKSYTIIAGDQSTDAKFFRNKLAEDKIKTSDETAAKRSKRMCLYDLTMGIVQNGKNPIDEQALLQDPAFMRLLIQLKLYNAEVKYSEKEEETLLKLVNTQEKRQVVQTFLKRAFAWKNEKSQAFSSSKLHKVLNKKRDAA